ncbi:MAG: L,D-transpeptidase family protein [Phycisphaerales bacterium]|nr:L,D-transpeptidase family protein [Phycisphaerales bacterium]
MVPPVRARLFALVRTRATVDERLAQFGPTARERTRAGFTAANVHYPPRRVTLIGLKQERRLEVWAGPDDGPVALVLSYPILAASGGPGPKLREGDRQVPEGLYRIESLNPNSLYHVALRVSYPSDEDRRQAAAEGRTNLGGDIMIHGSDASIGCLAMGDPAAEELFTLAADVGFDRIEVLLAPSDLRHTTPTDDRTWVNDRYDALRRRLAELSR